MRALVVEDSTTTRRILSQYLRDLRIQVYEAEDGKQGLDCLKATFPLDLVLVDWDMPVMNGIDFIRAVRQVRAFDPLTLIMVTTRSEKESVTIAFDAGANEYIQKPCSLDALREKLELLGLLEH
jgi:two-component system, chemotaxis family, chemotaxis protein CheY